MARIQSLSAQVGPRPVVWSGLERRQLPLSSAGPANPPKRRALVLWQMLEGGKRLGDGSEEGPAASDAEGPVRLGTYIKWDLKVRPSR